MTKAELIEKVAKVSDSELTKKQVSEVIENTFDIIAKTVKKEKKFSYAGFGTWDLRKRKARKGRNPATGEQIKIKASKTVGFKPAKAFKDML